MKRLLFILPLLTLLLACCTPHPAVPDTAPEPVEGPFQASPALSTIDSLMWHQPDSAFALLLRFAGSPEADSLDTFNLNYFHVLLSELFYKNNCAQSNRNELLQAVASFDSLSSALNVHPLAPGRHSGPDPESPSPYDDLPFLAARAHYINGVGYYESDSVVAACAEYLKALEVMEDHYKEKELVKSKAHFMAQVYTHLTGLFSDLYLQEQSIYFSRLSLLFYQKYDSPFWHKAWVLNKIGSQYDMMNNLDSASFYYSLATESLNDTNCLMYRDIAAHRAYLLYKKGNGPLLTLRLLQRLRLLAESEDEFLARTAVIGELYYHEKQYDSALNNLEKVFFDSKNTELRKQSAEWMVQIFKMQGNDYLEYADFLVPFSNQEENQSEVKSQLTELYKAYGQNRQERAHRQQMQKNRKWTIALIGGLLVVMSIIVILFYNSRRRKRQLELQISIEQYEYGVRQKALSERLIKSNEMLRDAFKRIEEQKTEEKNREISEEMVITGQARYKEFMESSICQEIIGRSIRLQADKRNALKTEIDVSEFKSFALTSTEFALLSRTAETQFPELYTSLKKRNPLNRKDWFLCLLYLMQLDKMVVCILLQESYPTCRRHVIKLEQSFQCQQQGLSVFLAEQIQIL